MKRTKRLLSTLLALCMVLAMLPATAMAAGSEPIKDRYTVLVLDHSGSMYGDPIKQLRDAAKLFCRTVAGDQTHGYHNQVAIVGFSERPDIVLDFTDNVAMLEQCVDSLEDTSTTDIYAALVAADELLKAKPNAEGTIKNIILLTDGLPVCGRSLPDGRYNQLAGIRNPGAANRCYQEVVDRGLLSPECTYNIYTLGFFHGLNKPDRTLCRALLSDLTHNSGTFYEMSDVNQVVVILGNFILDDLMNTVTPLDPDKKFDPSDPHLYVKFECPVEVAVSRTGETAPLFDSANLKDGLLSAETPYGIMTKTIKGENNNIIELRLNPNFSYYLGMTGLVDKGSANIEVYYNNQLIEKTKQPIQVNEGTVHATAILGVRPGSSIPSVYLPDYEYPEESVTDDAHHFTFVPTVTGGTVVLSKRNAEYGDWVNIYVTPDEGYKLESLTVTDQRGWPVTVREMGENAFSFTMPNARINVNPVFVKVEENDPYSTVVPDTIPNVDGTSPNYGNMVINTAAMNYSDVNAGDWFYNNVKFCHERYLLNNTGEADGKFEPNTASTRATVWTALSRLAGRNTITQGDNWYDRAQIWAKGKGITDGERPMDSMTREEFVTMLWRYDGNKYVQNNALGQFNDGTSVSWWATEAVKWAVATGLLNGSNGSLNPQSNVTRAEVAAVLQRYVQSVH